MAKKEEKKRYRRGGPARLDMRKGGRVGFAKGGGEKKKKQPVEIEPETKAKTEEELTGRDKRVARRKARQKTRQTARATKAQIKE